MCALLLRVHRSGVTRWSCRRMRWSRNSLKRGPTEIGSRCFLCGLIGVSVKLEQPWSVQFTTAKGKSSMEKTVKDHSVGSNSSFLNFTPCSGNTLNHGRIQNNVCRTPCTTFYISIVLQIACMFYKLSNTFIFAFYLWAVRMRKAILIFVENISPWEQQLKKALFFKLMATAPVISIYINPLLGWPFTLHTRLGLLLTLYLIINEAIYRQSKFWWKLRNRRLLSAGISRIIHWLGLMVSTACWCKWRLDMMLMHIVGVWLEHVSGAHVP